MKSVQSKNITSSASSNLPFFQKKESGNDFFNANNNKRSFFNSNAIQAKLSVGQPDDPYEKEADNMADKVVQRLSDNTSDNSKNNSNSFFNNSNTFLQRKCSHCDQEEKLQKKDKEDEQDLLNDKLQKKSIFESNDEPPDDEKNIQRACAECEQKEKVQKKPDSSTSASASADIESSLSSSKGSGSPMQHGTREQMESSFGIDFSGVRIHDDSKAAQMNKDLRAQAFTHGSDIYFNTGKYDTNSKGGQHLLAHELTHVIQQQNTSNQINRDGDPALANKTPAPVEKPIVPGKYQMQVRTSDGTIISYSENKDHIRYEVEKLVKKKGIPALNDAYFYLLQALKEFERPGAPSYDAPWHPMPPKRDLSDADEFRLKKGREVLGIVEIVTREMRAEYDKMIAKFYDQVQKTALQILNTNEERTEAERIRYGITWEDEQNHDTKWVLDCSDHPCARVLVYVKPQVTYYHMPSNLPSGGGLQVAARILLARRKTLEQKRDAASNAVKWEEDCSEHPCAHVLVPTSNWAPLHKDAENFQKDYENLLFVLSQDYPVLAHFGSLSESIKDLQKLADTPAGETIAKLLGIRMQEQMRNISKVKDGIKKNDVNFWKLPEVVDLTKVTLAISKDSVEEKLIHDKVESEKPGILQSIALVVMDVIAVLLAPATAGASLGVAAAVNVANTISDVKEYILKKAIANTDFDRAKGLSQEDPSLFWLAVSIVGVIPEIGDALKAFRMFGKAVKSMRAAKTVEEIAEVEKAMKQVGKEMKVADEVVANILSKAKKQDESLKVLGVSEKEISALKSASKAADTEALTNSVGVANAAINGEVKVSRRGLIFSCTSPCTVLREKYAAQLANDTSVVEELAKLEAEAASATTDQLRKEVAAKAAALEAKIRKVPLKTWKSPLSESSDFQEFVKKRGSIAPSLDRKPEGWTGAMEARFKYGDKAKPQEGYRWVLEKEGNLRYERMDRNLQKRYFDEEEMIFKEAVETVSPVKIETTAEMEALANVGKGATSTADWYAKLRKGIPALEHMSDDAIGRVMRFSPNVDHMKGQLLEEIAAEILKKDPKLAEKGVQFIPGHSIRDAAGKQLTDGMFVRKLPDGSMQIISVIESKAGAASAAGIRRSYKRYKDLGESELKELRNEAIEEFRVKRGLNPEPETVRMPAWAEEKEIMKSHPDEIEALMKDIHTGEAGQVQKDFERLMPNVDDATTTILIDGKQTKVKASFKSTNIVTVTPSDVSLKSTFKELGDIGIRAKGLEVGLTASELESLARKLRAERVINGTAAGVK